MIRITFFQPRRECHSIYGSLQGAPYSIDLILQPTQWRARIKTPTSIRIPRLVREYLGNQLSYPKDFERLTVGVVINTRELD